jgi:hypothetical protein
VLKYVNSFCCLPLLYNTLCSSSIVPLYSAVEKSVHAGQLHGLALPTDLTALSVCLTHSDECESEQVGDFYQPITGLDRPFGLQEVEAPRTSRQSAHEGGNVVSLYPLEISQVLISLTRWVDRVRLEGLTQMKNPNAPTGNQTRDFPACNSVSQPTAPPHVFQYYHSVLCFVFYRTLVILASNAVLIVSLCVCYLPICK